VDVNVVPVNVQGILRNQNVIVENGRITAIGSSKQTRIPAGAVRIPGQGKFLMPGLADMHAHFMTNFNFMTGERWDSADVLNRAEAILFVANGVTTVRNMWGGPEHLELRRAIESGEIIGPSIFTVGPLTDGKPPIWPGSRVVSTAEEARKAVDDDHRVGYDAIKVYNKLSAEAYSALVAQARQYNLPVYGHVPEAVGLLGALMLRQDSIEHLIGYLPALRRDGASSATVDDIDEKKISDIVRQTREAGTWNCVTIVVFQNFVSAQEAEKLRTKPTMKYVPSQIVNLWDPSTDFRRQSLKPEDFARMRRRDAFLLRLTKALYDGGVRLLVGTDTPNPFVVPGFSLHEELENFIKAGLTPYQTIKIATADAAESLGRQQEFGTVAVGKRADLLLLSANPLEDIGNVQKRVGVMVRGRWFSESELQNQLSHLVN
jgi:imidazolonepropionase-like amidohydrolase